MRPIVVGQCIYCGTTARPLKREHIIAAGLNGQSVLHQASCVEHERMTAAFEGQVLGPVLRSARAGLRMHMKKRPTTLPLLVDRGDGGVTSVDLPVPEFPAIATFVEFLPPAHLDGRAYSNGTSACGARIIHFAGPPPEDVARRLGARGLRWMTPHIGDAFPRLISKIAYAFVVADVGLSGIEDAYVLPAILGADDIGRWFGCTEPAYITDPRYLHGVAMQVIEREIIVRVRLFVSSQAPEYTVVVGRLAPGAQRGQFRSGPEGIVRARRMEDVLANAQAAPAPFLPPNHSIKIKLVHGAAPEPKS